MHNTYDSVAMCWGFNGYGRLGDGTTTFTNTPVTVSLPSGTASIAIEVGRFHSCAITDSGSTMCCGWNGNGQLADGTTATSITPTAATSMTTTLGITNSVDTVYSIPMSEFVAVEDDVFATRMVDDHLYV